MIQAHGPLRPHNITKLFQRKSFVHTSSCNICLRIQLENLIVNTVLCIHCKHLHRRIPNVMNFIIFRSFGL